MNNMRELARIIGRAGDGRYQPAQATAVLQVA